MRIIRKIHKRFTDPKRDWFYVMFMAISLCFIMPSTAMAGNSSCFGPGLWGNKTASGSILREYTVGVAHKTVPLKSFLMVKLGRKVIRVKVIDKGPFVKGRTLDLTEALVKKFGYANCKQWGHRDTKSWRVR